MFLYTYTFATNLIPLVSKEVSLYRNFVKCKWKEPKRRHSGKRKSKEGKEAQPENKTWANPP